MKELTAIITTFNRRESLMKLIKSIRKYYKDLQIIVVDNGNEEKAIRTKGVSYYKVPFDSGLSFSRNFAMSKVKTKYILLLDDDFEFTEKTDIVKLLKIAKDNDFDIVGGAVEGLFYNGILELEGSTLRYIDGDRGEVNGYKLYDMVLNFFIGKTNSIRLNECWDEELKLAEHTDFFWRAKKHNLKISFEPTVSIKHNHDRNKDYLKYRIRGKEYLQLFMEKNGIRRLINFVGTETTLKRNIITEEDEAHKNITFCIKTFERKPCLERLLFSITRFYPMAKIIIADDSKFFDVDYYKDLWKRLDDEGLYIKPVAYNLGYDMGLSYGRNWLVNQATTKYCLILDDDYEFTEKTDILALQTILDNDEEIGIAGGLVMNGEAELHFEHNFKVEDGILYHIPDTSEVRKVGNIKYTTPESIPNFFLMRKELGVKWDEDFKISEHTDFMFRLKDKWKTAYCREVSINHIHSQDPEYKKMRKREDFLIAMMKKNKWNKIIYLNGGGYEIKNGELIKF